MQHLWETLNTLFFGGPIPHTTFRWKKLPRSELGNTTSCLLGLTITMNPSRTSCDFADYVLLDFLSTLVHESIHAFLQSYACWSCRSWDRDYMEGGHGRSFQMLARKIEEAFPQLLGLPVRSGRLDSFLGDFGVREGKEKGRLKGCVPSVHDLEMWGFEDIDPGVRNEDVRVLIHRARAMGDV
ncbi:hypothetical protein BU23DRAFT_179068 [Bimuria novae-zelandiae CBS 107.79]|uniref:SprT-like domain-containing protein n=1 Tax=Bimuria novae-zelandiae CBS 107.79 TaxID=1447943 RepID=A0A6A5V2K1_9PLEO|nr:hypothetical protein BU23DRAFT_179068 [Bimuria novae-zelandiae CBS 107.79]